MCKNIGIYKKDIKIQNIINYIKSGWKIYKQLIRKINYRRR